MHTCYSLCTNEVLNLGLLNLNHPTRLLLSLVLQRCFSAEKMGKRPQMNKWDMYLYPPFKTLWFRSNSASIGMTGRSGQGDRTHRSVKYVSVSKRAVCSDWTLACVRSTPAGCVRSSKTLSGTLLLLTERWHPESGHFSVQRLVRGQ